MKWFATALMLFTVNCLASANDDMAMLMMDLKLKSNNNDMYKDALRAGKERATLCAYCHGVDGNSTRDYIPNLAQQNSQYLLKQFEFFRNGSRKDYVMGKIAKNLTREERVNIALYYANQRVKPRYTTQKEQDIKYGKKSYTKLCMACHGDKGHGQDDLPRISGQPASYIQHTLNDYRAKSKRRPNSSMIAIAEALTDKDILALSAYVSSLP